MSTRCRLAGQAMMCHRSKCVSLQYLVGIYSRINWFVRPKRRICPDGGHFGAAAKWQRESESVDAWSRF